MPSNITIDNLKGIIKDQSHFRSNNQVLDLELVSMHPMTIGSSRAKELWNADVRYVSNCFANFIRYNHDALNFLGIKATESAITKTLTLIPSLVVGCAPLISPKTGKPCGNLIVKSRFNDDITGIASLINGKIEIDYKQELRLNNSPIATPPLYLECVRYMEKYEEAKKVHWQKFSNFNKIERQPSSSTDWAKYASNSFDPARSLQYSNKVNRLILDHPEQLMLKYVLSLAIAEIESPRTPSKARQNLNSQIIKLKQEIIGCKLKTTTGIPLHGSDPIAIKELKEIANTILKQQSTLNCAWAFDISKFYERYVQYLFGQVVRRLGGRVISNQTYGITGQRPEWALKYIEPDIIIQFQGKTIIADAKYKRHMVNLNDKSKILRDSFREDLHQVLAYSSLVPGDNKEIMLCYPRFDGIINKTMYVQNPINGLSTKIQLLGIPLQKETAENTILFLCNLYRKK